MLRLASTLIFGLSCALAAGCGGQQQPATPTRPTITIGVVVPLTGDAGTFGTNAANGVRLAVEQAQADAPVKLDVKVEDSRGQAQDAVTATHKLIDADHATMIVGDVTSAGTHALLPIITAAGVPTISPAASDPKLSGASRLFARVWPSDVYEAQNIAAHGKDAGYHKVAAIYANTDYGIGMMGQFKANYPHGGIAIDIPLDRQTPDYRPTLNRVRSADADAIFMVLYPEDAKRMLQQMTELGVNLPILATATFEDPSLASLPNAKKVTFASPVPPDENTAGRQAFLEAYKARFGSDAGVLSDTGYDAAMLLIKAYEQYPGDGVAMMSWIRSQKDYPGVSGSMSFEDSGDVVKPYALKTVRDGNFVWVKELDATSGGPHSR